MKKILLLLCLFLGMQTYAQDEVRELTTVINSLNLPSDAGSAENPF